jgi:RNA 3'-terminal phosphate cyclase (ATP)
MLHIDGSIGEGGGQVLRTSLSLSLITQQPFTITKIRSNRKKPGLMPQHVKCVEVSAAIGGAEYSGAKFGSSEVTFIPKGLKPGDYRIDIGTAASTSLLLQTVFLPLSMAKDKSRIVVMGGTHVPWSPNHHYLTQHWLYYMRKIGLNGKLTFVRAGFYPDGEGKVIAEIRPHTELQPLDLAERGQLLRIKGVSAVANLDVEVAKRQRMQIARRLKPFGHQYQIRIENMRSNFKNSMVMLAVEYENGSACFTSLGYIGKRAETVADESINELINFINSQGTIDKYLADQLILPLAFVKKPSIFKTNKITPHLRTNIEVIKYFLNDVDFQIEEKSENEGIVKINSNVQ